MELCANGSSQTFQQIALYGIPSGSRPQTAPTDYTASTATSAATDFLLPANAKVRDNSTADATLTAAHISSSITLTWPASIVPSGSIINSVKVTIRHSEDSGVSGTLLSSLNGVSGSQSTRQLSSLLDETFDLSSLLPSSYQWKAVDAVVLPRSPFTATYSVAGPRRISRPLLAHLDDVVFTVGYSAPAFEGMRCPTGRSGCAIPVLLTDNKAEPVIHGTVYAPTAYLNVDLHNKTTNLFTRGVIARTITAQASASFKQLASPFQLPSGSPPVRLVLFTVSRQDPRKVLLRAKVQYMDFAIDGSGAHRAFPGRATNILNWSVLR
jgi:hypothetical protein